MNRINLVIIILVVFSALNGSKWLYDFISSPYRPVDFRTYYFSTKAAIQGDNPYAHYAINKLWIRHRAFSGTDWEGPAGSPHARTVYAPQFIWFFAVFSLVNFEYAKWLHFILILLAFVASIALTCSLSSHPAALIISALTAFRGTWYMLDTGQPMPYVFAACLFALRLAEKKKQILLPGLLIGLVSFKFTLIIPFTAWMLVRRKYNMLLTAALTSLALNISALLYFGHPGVWLSQWFENMQQMWNHPHIYGQVNGLSVISTSISVPIAYWFRISTEGLRMAMFTAYFTVSILLTLSFLKNGTTTKYRLLFLLQLTGLCIGQHLVYDFLALVCFLLFMNEKNVKIRLPDIALGILLLLPMGRIAEIAGIEWIHYILPVVLFMVWMQHTVDYLFRKYKPAKKAS